MGISIYLADSFHADVVFYIGTADAKKPRQNKLFNTEEKYYFTCSYPSVDLLCNVVLYSLNFIYSKVYLCSQLLSVGKVGTINYAQNYIF